MLYTLFCIEGGTRNVLPSVDSLASLKLACAGGYGAHGHYEITANAISYARSITVSLPVPTSGDGGEFLDAGVTHIAIQKASGAVAVMYYVTSCVPISRATSPLTYSLRMTAELCGVFTAALNGCASVQRWEFERYTPADQLQNRTTEPIDGAFALSKTTAASLDYVFPDDYVVAVTFVAEPGDPLTDLQYGNVKYAPYYTSVLTAFSRVAQTSKVPIEQGVKGATALQAWRELCKVNPNLKDKVYRAQLIPQSLAIGLVGTDIQDLRWTWDASHGQYQRWASFTILPASGGITAMSKTPPVLTTDIHYRKSYGEPSFELWQHGDKTMEFPAIPPNAGLTGVVSAGCDVTLCASMSNGVNAYLLAKWINGLVVGKTSYALPEVVAVADGLTVWWEGAKGQVISSAAMGLAALGITIATAATGGAAAPVLAAASGLIGSGLGTAMQAQQASQHVQAVGSGAQDLFAADSNTKSAVLYYNEYDYTARHERDNYFALNGYSGHWSFAQLPLSAAQRSHYWYARGRGDVRLSKESYNLPCTDTDLAAAVTEEIGNGVYFWYTNIQSPLSVANS